MTTQAIETKEIAEALESLRPFVTVEFLREWRKAGKAIGYKNLGRALAYDLKPETTVETPKVEPAKVEAVATVERPKAEKAVKVPVAKVLKAKGPITRESIVAAATSSHGKHGKTLRERWFTPCEKHSPNADLDLMVTAAQSLRQRLSESTDTKKCADCTAATHANMLADINSPKSSLLQAEITGTNRRLSHPGPDFGSYRVYPLKVKHDDTCAESCHCRFSRAA